MLLTIPAEIQLLFVADLKHKRMSQIEGAKKHGRNIVTFLLITNLGLWITYNFEIQKVHKMNCFTLNSTDRVCHMVQELQRFMSVLLFGTSVKFNWLL